MYRLTYWAKRGRAEQVRLLLEVLGEPYENVHIDAARLEALRSRGPEPFWFGSVPMLQDGEFHLVQGCAIMGYLGRKHGLGPSDPRSLAHADAMTLGAEDLRTAYLGLWGEGGPERQPAFVAGPWSQRWLPRLDALLAARGTGYLVGPDLTHGDVAMWDALDAILAWVPGASLDGFGHLQRFREALAARPRVAAYLISARRASG